jgi:hypothetical protein
MFAGLLAAIGPFWWAGLQFVNFRQGLTHLFVGCKIGYLRRSMSQIHLAFAA